MDGSLLAGYRLLLCLTGALIAVLLLRLFLRYVFGSRTAYLIWLLVPIAIMGSAAGSLAPRKVFTILTLPVQLAEVHLPWSPLSRASSSFGQMNWVTVGWTLGVVLFASIQWWQQYAFMRRLGVLQRMPNGAWMAEHTDIGPAVVGVLPPRIVLPADFYQRYTAPEQAFVLTHESIHVLRHDPLANFVMAIVRSLFWFHPLVHLAVRYFRIDQELACDAEVLGVHTQDRHHYARAILKSQAGGLTLPAGCHLDSQAATFLKRRIIMLQTVPPSHRRRALGTVVTLALLITGLALTLPSSALAQTTLTDLLGTWVRQPDADSWFKDIRFTIQSDSILTVTTKGNSEIGRVINGRVTKLAGDTAAVRFVDPDDNEPETLSYVITLNDQKLAVRELDPEGGVYVFTRANVKP